MGGEIRVWDNLTAKLLSGWQTYLLKDLWIPINDPNTTMVNRMFELGSQRLDNWIQRSSVQGKISRPADTIHRFEDTLKLHTWPAMPQESTGLVKLTDSMTRLYSNTSSIPSQILSESRHLPALQKVERDLDGFLRSLSFLVRKCESADHQITKMLQTFALPANSEGERRIFNTTHQNARLVEDLVEKYSRQVARHRAERQRHTNEILAFDNEAIMNADHEPSLLTNQDINQITAKRATDQAPEELPHPREYDQPVKAEMIQKMIHRMFMGIQLPVLTMDDLALPYNLDAKYVLRRVTGLQIFPTPAFPAATWKAAFHSRLGQNILTCVWWWIFISDFRKDIEQRDSILSILLRRLAKMYRTLYRKISASFRDTILEVYPDCIAQAVYIVFNELYPFQRTKFAQPDFLTDLETRIHKWFMGDLAAISEHYRFRWQEWRFEYMDLNKINDPLCYPQFFDLKRKTEPVPQACNVLGTETVVLDIPRYKTTLLSLIDGEVPMGRSDKRRPVLDHKLEDESPIEPKVATEAGKPSLDLSESRLVGRTLKFGMTSMDVNNANTPLLELEVPKPKHRPETAPAGVPMIITSVAEKYDSSLTYHGIAAHLERRIKSRKRRMQRDKDRFEESKRDLLRQFWKASREISSLQERISMRRIKRSNVAEYRLEVTAAQDTERHLPSSMRKKIRRGELPPIVEFKSAKKILTHEARSSVGLSTFVGPFFDAGLRTKLTGWDHV